MLSWRPLFPFIAIVIAWSCIYTFVTFTLISFIFSHIMDDFKLKKGRVHLCFLCPGDPVRSSVPDTCYCCYQCLILIGCASCARHCSRVLYITHVLSPSQRLYERELVLSRLRDEETETRRSWVAQSLTVRKWQSWDSNPANMVPQSDPSLHICWTNEWIMINTEGLWDSELERHVYIFRADLLAHAEMSPTATLRVSSPDSSETFLAMWTH